jgi:hypothetical protein
MTPPDGVGLSGMKDAKNRDAWYACPCDRTL